MGYAVKLSRGGTFKIITTAIHHPNNMSYVEAGIGDIISVSNNSIIGAFENNNIQYARYNSGSYGAPYDFTITLTNSLKIRYYCGTNYGGTTFDVYLLKNDVVANTTTITVPLRLDYAYTSGIGILQCI